MSPTDSQNAEIAKLTEENAKYLEMIISQEDEVKLLEERVSEHSHQISLNEEEIDALKKLLGKSRERNEELEVIINDKAEFVPTSNSSQSENDVEVVRQLYNEQGKRLQPLAAKLTYTNPKADATAKEFAEKIKNELEVWSCTIRNGQGLTRILDGTEDVQSILKSINENISSLRGEIMEMWSEWRDGEDNCGQMLNNVDSPVTTRKNKRQNQTIIQQLEKTNEKLTEELKALKEENKLQDYANDIMLRNMSDIDFNEAISEREGMTVKKNDYDQLQQVHSPEYLECSLMMRRYLKVTP
ncbi:hypothetical protein SNEBB_004637 [Seison nebaliae]|nr:hypothetical protein SNEBB_004637 [Seison nebaliae]